MVPFYAGRLEVLSGRVISSKLNASAVMSIG